MHPGFMRNTSYANNECDGRTHIYTLQPYYVFVLKKKNWNCNSEKIVKLRKFTAGGRAVSVSEEAAELRVGILGGGDVGGDERDAKSSKKKQKEEIH